VNIFDDAIKRIVVCEKIVQVDEAINREWLTFPVLVELHQKPAIKTNWENKEARWVPLDKIEELKLVPFYPEVFQAALSVRSSGI
jgi:hypothetical protein